MKSPRGGKNGGKFGAIFVVLVVIGLIFIGINNGTMKSMNGQQVSFFDRGDALNRIETAAGSDVYVSSGSSGEGVSGSASGSAPYDFDGSAGVSESAPYQGDYDGSAFYEDDFMLDEPVQQNSCGDYEDWVGKKLSERVVKATGKPYRILKPNSPVTQDYSPDRINVITNEDDIIIEVKCG